MAKDILDLVLKAVKGKNKVCYHRPYDNRLFLDPQYKSCLIDLDKLNLSLEEVREQYGLEVVNQPSVNL